MIDILDTTLRDGLQSAGIRLTVNERIEIVKLLDELGVSYIEAGNPFSNTGDKETFKRINKLNLKNSEIVAFGMTQRTDYAKDDPQILALLNTDVKVVSIVCKAYDLHVKNILKVDLQRNLDNIFNTVKFLKDHDRKVILDMEHFFDAYKLGNYYCEQVIETASQAEADTICMCDTVGKYFPHEIEKIFLEISDKFPEISWGIHTHNDNGCAVANSVTAANLGIRHIQGTLLGIGERCGNADITTIIPDIQLIINRKCVYGDLKDMSRIVERIADILNIYIEKNRPYIGENAFAHKAGIHADGNNKIDGAYEHIQPEDVGNHSKLIVSELSGRTLIAQKTKEIIPNRIISSKRIKDILNRVKDMSISGYDFDYGITYEVFIYNYLGVYHDPLKIEYLTIDKKKSADYVVKLKLSNKGIQKVVEWNIKCGIYGILDLVNNTIHNNRRVPSLEIIEHKFIIDSKSESDKEEYKGILKFRILDRTYKLMNMSNNYIYSSINLICDAINYCTFKFYEELSYEKK